MATQYIVPAFPFPIYVNDDGNGTQFILPGIYLNEIARSAFVSSVVRRLLISDDTDDQPPPQRARLDGGANRGLEIAKMRDYAILLPPTAVSIAKALDYAVLLPPLGISVAKAITYVVLLSVPGGVIPIPVQHWRIPLAADEDDQPVWRPRPVSPVQIFTISRRLTSGDEDDQPPYTPRRFSPPAAIMLQVFTIGRRPTSSEDEADQQFERRWMSRAPSSLIGNTRLFIIRPLFPY